MEIKFKDTDNQKKKLGIVNNQPKLNSNPFSAKK